MIRINAIDTLRNATTKGCTFITFLYQKKTTGEVSKYQINFGINYRNACEIDKAALEAYQPKDALEEQAKAEMVKSLTETLTEGVSQAYTQKDTYETIGRGIRQHKETGEIYIHGFIHSKEQIVPPTTPKKPVNSRPLTLAKNKIKKELDLKRNKFGDFIINPDNIAGILVNGDVIQIQN